jgi:phosphoesterase RecJ-like protein
MPKRTAKQIYTTLRNANRVLLVPHKNPDGDALGSVTALIHLLQKWNKEHLVFCATEYSEKLGFLPGIEHFATDESVWKDSSIDCVVILDTGDLSHAGISEKLYEMNPKPFIINIDHHATNKMFGDLNLVIEKASSTCEVLYDFCKVNHIKIDKHTATCLLTGIVTDTGNFTNSATTVQSLQIASDLIHKGGNMNLIKEVVFKDKTVNGLKLWGTMLSRLAKHDEHEIVYTYITQKDLAEHKAGESEVEGMANFMNGLSEGKAALVLRELPDGAVKGSLRTTHHDYDVSSLASSLGGGGHKKAAGFTVAGPVDSALSTIWQTLDERKQV